MKPRVALFPGSFDPITRGHESVILRALPLFDRIIVAIGLNADKKCMFPEEQRLEWVRTTFSEYPAIVVMTYEGLTVDFAKKAGAAYILRGLRTAADFEFERAIGQTNRVLMPDIETIFFLTDPQFAAVSSSIVRDVFRNGGDTSPFVPEKVKLK
ncbi:MAG: pantetheine-phosphate adenylyltransferase [Bacteroidales bacterium]